MTLLDRWGNPLPEPPKHVRSLGFHGGTRPLKDDEDVVECGNYAPKMQDLSDHEPPVAI